MRGSELLSTTQVARQLGLQPYQLAYLLATGKVREPGTRVAGKRAWRPEEVERAAQVLRGRANEGSEHDE